MSSVRIAKMPKLDAAMVLEGAMPSLDTLKVECFRRTEIHCHECNNYVQFDLDESINGNHVLHCPVCNHEHCRVVHNGEVTGERWDSRNGPTIQVNSSTTSWSSTSAYGGSYATSTANLRDLWLDSTSANTSTGF